ncbi:MAG: hypothetical protein EOO03_17345 [Chitinophagaceae bacterium]|nr:MAG: hypothetical protein EOO03_17345 [Chitinophagaceae bacterium]
MKRVFLFVLMMKVLFAAAQTEEQGWTYRIAVGVGVGHSPSFEESKNGLGAMIDFSLQKNRSLLALSYRATGEAQLLAQASPSHTMSSVDFLYGWVLSEKKLLLSLSAGAGFTTSLERGALVSSGPGIFSPRHYAKLRMHALGLPVSAIALLQIGSKARVGFEGYYNLNRLHNFYGINLVASFGKYAVRRKKKSE